MKPITLDPSRKLASVLFAIAFMIFSSIQHISAQQVSTFTIPGWTSGVNPIFTGAGSNVISLQYGDSLTTSVAFDGSPTDGIGNDQDNIAFQSFSYSYTVYLTPNGSQFSAATSIPVGTHSVGATQSCSSGTMPPWTLSYDGVSAGDTNSFNKNIRDGIADCIAPGDYHVDIVLDSYAVNSVGSAALPLQLQWNGYANNSPVRALTEINAPSTNNTNDVALSPVSSYILSKVAFVHIAAPASCPPVTLSLPASIGTFASTASATVSASYSGHCDQNAFTYLWSNGETTATATDLHRGTHTVTVTSPCGATATASVTISLPTTQVASASTRVETLAPIAVAAHATGGEDNNKTKKTHTKAEAHMQLYPNPAKHNITFDFTTESAVSSTITIYDMMGNEVMKASNDTNAEAGNQKMEINIDSLPVGAYLYELNVGELVRGRFVKQ